MSGMETLNFEFTGTRRLAPFAPVLVGVVASGNLEVLLESRRLATSTSMPASAAPAADQCVFHIETSARGFGAIWEAVLRDFHERHALAGASIAINDMGATPAVVSLRLDQAVAGLPTVVAPVRA